MCATLCWFLGNFRFPVDGWRAFFAPQVGCQFLTSSNCWENEGVKGDQWSKQGRFIICWLVQSGKTSLIFRWVPALTLGVLGVSKRNQGFWYSVVLDSQIVSLGVFTLGKAGPDTWTFKRAPGDSPDLRRSHSAKDVNRRRPGSSNGTVVAQKFIPRHWGTDALTLSVLQSSTMTSKLCTMGLSCWNNHQDWLKMLLWALVADTEVNQLYVFPAAGQSVGPVAEFNDRRQLQTEWTTPCVTQCWRYQNPTPVNYRDIQLSAPWQTSGKMKCMLLSLWILLFTVVTAVPNVAVAIVLCCCLFWLRCWWLLLVLAVALLWVLFLSFEFCDRCVSCCDSAC